MRNPELWARLSAFEFDKGTGSAPFSVKLAQAEGWSAGFTARVIEEYRRFIYLTQVSDRQATPSQTVDAAWHMHLTFTRDYWEDLCPTVLGKPLHHQPCAGEEEMPRYRDQFAVTKALYEAEFGKEPPADIWGRDPARQAPRSFALDEAGSVNGQMLLLLLAVAMSVGLYLYDSNVHWSVFTIILGTAFLLGLINRPRRRRKRRRKSEGDAVWMDGSESDAGSGGNGGRNSGAAGSTTSSKQSQSNDTSTGKSNSGGFWAFFGGDGNDDGGGGGCGGCGGD